MSESWCLQWLFLPGGTVAVTVGVEAFHEMLQDTGVTVRYVLRGSMCGYATVTNRASGHMPLHGHLHFFGKPRKNILMRCAEERYCNP